MIRLLLTLLAAQTVSAQVITLDDFLVRVEQTHPALRSASYEPDLANAEITSALGRFDPSLNARLNYEDKDGQNKLGTVDALLSMPLNTLFGPSISASYGLGQGSSVNPETLTATAGEASLGISLPLFQGIFTDERRNQLNKALIRPEVANAQFRTERNLLLRSAAMACWTWAEAESEVAVVDSVIRLIETRREQLKRRAASGEQAAIDTVEVAQEYVRRIGQRLQALRLAEQAKVNASVFVWTPDGRPAELTQSPSPLPSGTSARMSQVEAIAEAVVNRPEVQRLAALQKVVRLDSALATEYLRPYVRLDAVLAAYDVAQIGKVDYKVGLYISQPLMFRTASGNAQVANIAVQRADLSFSIVERIVAADAQNAVITVERTLQRLEVARQEVALAQQMVAAERSRFEAGESSLLTLNLRERFLAEALSRVVAASAELARAEATLRWATGTI
jgi:outer membrane protein TolC